MTPPKPAASAGASADVKVETPPPPPAPAPEVKPVEDPDPKKWEWRLSSSLSAEEQGGRNGGLFAIDNISQFGDFIHLNFDGAFMRDLLGSTVRFRVGPYASFDASKGNQNTSGSSLYGLTVGPRAELDWSRVYKGGLGGILEGPGVVALYAGLGYGWGTTNVDGGFQLHSQSGLATAVGADINAFRINIGNVALDFGPKFQTNSIYGSDFNNAGWNIGGFIAVRPSTKKMTETKYEEKCDSDVDAIARQEAKIKNLKAENETTTAQLGELRFYLEAHPKHPFTSANMRKALVIGAVAEQLNIKKVDPTKIAEAVRQANKGDTAKTGEIMAKVTGAAPEDVKKMVEVAEGRYPQTFDFWAAPEDPAFGTHPEIPANPKGDQCKDVKKYRDELEEIVGKLERRKGALETLYKTAVYLAGLYLGETETKDILSATIINVDTPSFKTARPNEADMSKLKGGTSADTIADQVFSAPKFEKEKLDKLAAWLRGEGKLPGEERIRAVLNEELAKKGKSAMDDSPAAQDAFKEFVKKLSLGIFGHTDSDGGEEMNQKLSERRADFVKAYLVARGVEESRLVTRGFGKKYPVMPETSGNQQERLIAKGKNRRIEFVPIGITEPITPSAGQQAGHVDSKEVPKADGGTAPDASSKPATKPATKPAAPPPPAPPPQKPAPKPGATDF